MHNTILKSLTAENYTSFADKIYFTTVADPAKKEYWDNTFLFEDFAFNKVSFLYGANGSGKTFFCKILREIQRLLDWSPLTAMNNRAQLLAMPQFKGIDTQVPTFAFDTAYQDRPTSFGIDICVDDVTYHYEFSIKGKKIVSEILTKKHRRTETLLNRTSPSFKNILLRSELKKFETTKHVVKDEALCLPVAALLNNTLAEKIVSAISNINILSMTTPRIQPAESEDSFSQERIDKYVNIVKKADPTLRKMTVSFEEKETVRQKLDVDDFENREIIAKLTTVDVKSEHAVYENGVEKAVTSIEFFTDESLGTIKLFTALPHLYNTLEKGGILFIDELENGLHLSLAKEIVGLFTNDKTNPNGAQLICTSHQPLLISENVRRDQVWIVKKDKYGKSSLQRMSDLKTSRAKINLSNRLLEGAFGCNPEPFFNTTHE